VGHSAKRSDLLKELLKNKKNPANYFEELTGS